MPNEIEKSTIDTHTNIVKNQELFDATLLAFDFAKENWPNFEKGFEDVFETKDGYFFERLKKTKDGVSVHDNVAGLFIYTNSETVKDDELEGKLIMKDSEDYRNIVNNGERLDVSELVSSLKMANPNYIEKEPVSSQETKALLKHLDDMEEKRDEMISSIDKRLKEIDDRDN